jgi:hypothetical protein
VISFAFRIPLAFEEPRGGIKMVARKRSSSTSKVKVNKLKVNKETLKNLKPKEANQIKGGQRPIYETAGCVSVNACGTGWSKCCD